MERPIPTGFPERRKRKVDAELRNLFHVLWTKAVGTPSYVKEEWINLQNKLDDHRLSV